MNSASTLPYRGATFLSDRTQPPELVRDLTCSRDHLEKLFDNW